VDQKANLNLYSKSGQPAEVNIWSSDIFINYIITKTKNINEYS